MNMYDILEKKRHGEALSAEEIDFFVEGYTAGSIEDFEASALLTAIAICGMTREETYLLTKSMLESGETVDLGSVRGVLADKHSTGGVSDSTTLIVAPVLAACGVKVAKMSGRSLGHTGGTVDKLESFDGYDTAVTAERFVEIVNAVGVSVTGQTAKLAPADKKLYTLRDLTATVDSIPLIASSIMSKKLATGVDHILLDVKYGGGAFMKDPKDAVRLAKCMTEIGARAGKNVEAMVTRMSAPLGNAVGCNLEVREAVAVLSGGEGDLAALSRKMAAKLLVMTGTAETREAALERVDTVIADGSAKRKLKEMVAAHGGNASYVEHPERLETAEFSGEVTFEQGGTVSGIDAERIGKIASGLGAGRKTKFDAVDHKVGVLLSARVGDTPEPGGVLAKVYAASSEALERAVGEVFACFAFDGEIPAEPLVYAEVSAQTVTYDPEIDKMIRMEDAVVDYEQELDRAGEEFKYKSVVEKIEHTLLSQTATPEQLKKLCDEASEYRFATVCVLPTHVADCVRFLGVNSVRVCTVVGFPYGEDVTPVKAFATKQAVKAGAQEIDMVMCVSKAKQGAWKYVTKDIQKVVKASQKRTVKVIIEASLLTEEEIRKATDAVVAAGADYVKTSTGLFGGATTEVVRTIRDELGKLHPVKAVGIKAAGGIRSKRDAYALLDAGATRLGTSKGMEIALEVKSEMERKVEEIGKTPDTV